METPARPQRDPATPGLKGLLRQPLRVTVSDGRIFLGTFAGTDKQLNIVIINAEEFRIDGGGNMEGRYVGQLMVPWRFVIRVETQRKEESEVRKGNHSDFNSIGSNGYDALYL